MKFFRKFAKRWEMRQLSFPWPEKFICKITGWHKPRSTRFYATSLGEMQKVVSCLYCGKDFLRLAEERQLARAYDDLYWAYRDSVLELSKTIGSFGPKMYEKYWKIFESSEDAVDQPTNHEKILRTFMEMIKGQTDIQKIHGIVNTALESSKRDK